MINTASIEQFETHVPGVYAFRVKDEVTREDLEAMAQTMNTAFDRLDELDMLISFKSDLGSEFGANLDAEVLKAQFRSISKVRNYCVAGAPEAAEAAIRFFRHLIPVEAKTFDSEHNAIEHLRAQSPLTG